jgi:hypothetical protein
MLRHYSRISISTRQTVMPRYAIPSQGTLRGGRRRGPCCGKGLSISPPNFIFLRPAVQKLITTVPFRHLSVRPGVCSNHTASSYPSAKYEPRTCPHSKVINQRTLHSLYNSTSLICISMYIHDAPISLLRRIARISVVTEASRMKLLHECSPAIVGEPVYFFYFPKDCFLLKYFSETGVVRSEKSQFLTLNPTV